MGVVARLYAELDRDDGGAGAGATHAAVGRVALDRGVAAPAAGDDAARRVRHRDEDVRGSHGTSFCAFTISYKKSLCNL